MALMSDQPLMPRSAMRGAVDLSGIGQRPTSPSAPAGAAGGGAATGGAAAGGLRVDASEAGFQEAVLSTRDVPALLVLWSAAHPETEQAVTSAVTVAQQQAGRLRVIAVEVQANPGIAGAVGAQQIPMTLGLIAGQPVPLFTGVQAPDQLAPLVAEILKVAQENGVTGRFDPAAAPGAAAAPAEPPTDPRYDAAFDALEAGDYDGAIAVYRQILKESPAEEDAKVGLAQVELMKRLAGADQTAARAAAAADPTDIDAQLLVADLDLSGGHVEDAFARLVDLVRVTADEERERVRARLLDLFEIVGPRDERVVKGRRALMSALF